MRLQLADHWTIILPIVCDFRNIAAAFLIAWAAFCCAEPGTDRDREPILNPLNEAVPREELAARVDGVPVTLDDVRAVMEEHAEPLTRAEALDIAVRTELLASEARKRGFGYFDRLRSARRAAMARVLLERTIDEGLGPKDVPLEVIERAYERQKERFVHGAQRKVAHILVRDKKDPDGARGLAAKIYRAAKDVSSPEEFEGVFEGFSVENPKKVKLEKLPPFDKDTKKLVSEFVVGAFAIPKAGKVGEPVRTEFGYHVIYVVEELPAESVSFEEARPQLEEELLPELKKRRARELEQRLYKQGDVFIFENVLPILERTP